MKTLRRLVLIPAVALLAIAGFANAAVPPAATPAMTDITMRVGADCYAIGEGIAAQQGGTLARATQRNRGGRTVCVIVVLVPGRDGERPRRAEFVVPAN